MNLTYRPDVMVEDLQPGECTIHSASDGKGSRKWWLLWFYVPREDNGVLTAFAVPVNPRGTYQESGAGGRTWGLNPSGPGTWQVSPSIDAKSGRVAVPGGDGMASAWHQTPAVVGVPDGERWQ